MMKISSTISEYNLAQHNLHYHYYLVVEHEANLSTRQTSHTDTKQQKPSAVAGALKYNSRISITWRNSTLWTLQGKGQNKLDGRAAQSMWLATEMSNSHYVPNSGNRAKNTRGWPETSNHGYISWYSNLIPLFWLWRLVSDQIGMFVETKTWRRVCRQI